MKDPAKVRPTGPGCPGRARIVPPLLLPLLLLRAAEALAAGGGKPARKLVNVADTRNLGPGFTAWVADLYNSSYWLFALLVVVIMVFMGLALGYACDRLMALLGINLGKMSHHE